ncbi:MAG: serine--tRNA ligase, partial [Dehalococcoidales bacterium]
MLDLRFIRENIDLVRQAVASRQDVVPLDEILKLGSERRQKILELEGFRRVRKEAAREKKQISPDEGRDLRAKIRELEEEVRSLDEQLEELLLRVPNIPQPTVPVGEDEEGDVLVRWWGEPLTSDFQLAPHWKLGESLGIIDFERGVKLSGSRFYVLKGLGARLQRALISFMLDLHTSEHGYNEVYPPFMVKRECMVGSGNLPKFANNLYHDAEDDLWFVPTAEVPITNLHRDEIIPPGILPIYYVAYTACFRREKMSAGKDTRGLKRGHQFDKVEIYKFTEPATSNEELEKLVSDAEQVCRQLGLPYRVLEL